MTIVNYNFLILYVSLEPFSSILFTFKYCWYGGPKVHSASWQIPYPGPRNINGVKAGVMVSKHLHRNIT